MNVLGRIAAFTAGLVAVLGVSAAAGSAWGPEGMPRGDTAAHGADSGGHAATEDAPSHSDHGAETAQSDPAIPAGLQTAEQGYRLLLDSDQAPAGAQAPIGFRVVGPDNRALTAYTTSHDKDLHLIAVRRDLTGFQHVHPARDAGGRWTARLDLTPGTWRIFADFDPAGAVEDLTLGTDLEVAGSFAPQKVPIPKTTAGVDGYTVRLTGGLTPGRDSQLTLTVSRHGAPVTDLQPYLAAYGHLVALRAGDLAYLHVHPEGRPGDGSTAAGPAIVFHTTAPSAGTYRLFLDFKHGDVVRTAAFTVTAGKEPAGHGH